MGWEAATNTCPLLAPTVARRETPGQTGGLCRDTLGPMESWGQSTGGSVSMGGTGGLCAPAMRPQSSPGHAEASERGVPSRCLALGSPAQLLTLEGGGKTLRGRVYRPSPSPVGPSWSRSSGRRDLCLPHPLRDAWNPFHRLPHTPPPAWER